MEENGEEPTIGTEIKREESSSRGLEGHATGDNEDKPEDEYTAINRKVKEEFPEQYAGRFKGCGHEAYNKEHGPRNINYFENIRSSSIAVLRRRAKEHEVLITSQNPAI